LFRSPAVGERGVGEPPRPARPAGRTCQRGSAVNPPGGAPVSDTDLAVVAAQLGRAPRGTRAVAQRCPCGLPDVVETAPRLPDGTPFPTLFYLTCPKAVAACSRLESAGVMREMTARLAEDGDLAQRYRAAHEDYLALREAIVHVPEIARVSAGGTPARVQCLHALLAHSLAVGRAVNPFGDE